MHHKLLRVSWRVLTSGITARVAKLAASESIRLNDLSPSNHPSPSKDKREIRREGLRIRKEGLRVRGLGFSEGREGGLGEIVQQRERGKRASSLTGTTVTTPPLLLPTASTIATPLGSRKEHGAQRYSTCSSGALYIRAQRHSFEEYCLQFPCDNSHKLQHAFASTLYVSGSFKGLFWAGFRRRPACS
jgi:hypothetical protein